MVTLNKVNKIFGKEVKTQVLFDIDLEVPQEQFMALIGPSGSGKSTLLNLLGALDRPTSGDIIIGGQNLTTLSDNKLAIFRNRFLGFIFQFHYLLPEFTALENVLMPHWISGGGNDRKITEEAKRLIDRVGLSSQMNKRINLLSGGQQQRIAIARALLNKPKLILADEPTGALDSKSGDQVLELLREINSENHTTFIVVTHDRSIAMRAERIVELRDGLVCKDLKPAMIGVERTTEELESHECTV